MEMRTRGRSRYGIWIFIAIVLVVVAALIFRGDRIENPFNGLRLVSFFHRR